MTKIISIQNATHFDWGHDCHGWFLKNDGLFSVISEEMPPQAFEIPHYHEKTEQCFYVLKGCLTMVVDGKNHTLLAGDSLIIYPKQVHQAINTSHQLVQFLVISSPNNREDRVNLDESI